jgi:hypothetical protein
MDQVRWYLTALFAPHPVDSNSVWTNGDVIAALAAGYFVIFLPLIPAYSSFRVWYDALQMRRTMELAAAYACFLLVLGSLAVSSFQAFIYFRF